MYALFEETEAARQCERYAADKGVDPDELKRKCYGNALKQADYYERLAGKDYSDKERFDNWWIGQCLKDDAHKTFDVSFLFTWDDTPEGHELWIRVNFY